MTSDTAWTQLHQEVITCRACPRLVEWRERMAREKRRAYREWDYWGKPVPSFGDEGGRLFVVGLAPGAHGANRTGRVFTGDSSGDTLYTAMHEAGFANQTTSRHRGDGLQLQDALVTAVARCAPPKNRPTAAELTNCRPFLIRELQLMPQVQVIVALGQMAFDGCQRLLRETGHDLPRLKFGHGVHYKVSAAASDAVTGSASDRTRHLLAAYHPSRQNTQTGRLTQAMLNEVFLLARSLLE